MTRAGQGAGRGRRARRPGPPAGGPCSPLGARAGGAAAPAHARGCWLARWPSARPPARPPAGSVPGPPDPAISGSLAPGSVFIGARAPRSLCEKLYAKKPTVSRVGGVKPGRKTKPQAAAAQAGSGRRRGRGRGGDGGGGRGGGRENRAGGGAGIGLAVQVVLADCGESWWLPAGARAQVREASTLPRRAWTGNYGA